MYQLYLKKNENEEDEIPLKYVQIIRAIMDSKYNEYLTYNDPK